MAAPLLCFIAGIVVGFALTMFLIWKLNEWDFEKQQRNGDIHEEG